MAVPGLAAPPITLNDTPMPDVASTTDSVPGKKDKPGIESSTTNSVPGKKDKPGIESSTTNSVPGKKDKPGIESSTTNSVSGKKDKPGIESKIFLGQKIDQDALSKGEFFGPEDSNETKEFYRTQWKAAHPLQQEYLTLVVENDKSGAEWTPEAHGKIESIAKELESISFAIIGFNVSNKAKDIKRGCLKHELTEEDCKELFGIDASSEQDDNADASSEQDDNYADATDVVATQNAPADLAIEVETAYDDVTADLVQYIISSYLTSPKAKETSQKCEKILERVNEGLKETQPNFDDIRIRYKEISHYYSRFQNLSEKIKAQSSSEKKNPETEAAKVQLLHLWMNYKNYVESCSYPSKWVLAHSKDMIGYIKQGDIPMTDSSPDLEDIISSMKQARETIKATLANLGATHKKGPATSLAAFRAILGAEEPVSKPASGSVKKTDGLKPLRLLTGKDSARVQIDLTGKGGTGKQIEPEETDELQWPQKTPKLPTDKSTARAQGKKRHDNALSNALSQKGKSMKMGIQPGYALDREICGYRACGRGGYQLLLRKDMGKGQPDHWALVAAHECGKHALKGFRSLYPNQRPLVMNNDKELTKRIEKDANFITNAGILGIACVVRNPRIRESWKNHAVSYISIESGDWDPLWVTFTGFRNILGRREADQQIKSFYKFSKQKKPIAPGVTIVMSKGEAKRYRTGGRSKHHDTDEEDETEEDEDEDDDDDDDGDESDSDVNTEDEQFIAETESEIDLSSDIGSDSGSNSGDSPDSESEPEPASRMKKYARGKGKPSRKTSKTAKTLRSEQKEIAQLKAQLAAQKERARAKKRKAEASRSRR